MKHLPQLDGQDKVTGLAKRISDNMLWIQGFQLWMLGMAAQWTGKEMIHANALVLLLISRQQRLQKSTFCKLLVPNELQAYYTDSFDLASPAAAEQKLALLGLINLDEELLTDPTGSRHFLCIEVNEEIDSSPIDHAQLKTLLDQGEQYWMNKSVQRLAQTLSAIGIERIHTRCGNLYRVVSHPSQ